MGDTHFRVSESNHEKMKEIAKKKGILIRESYDSAIENYIKNESEKLINQDSCLELFINEKIGKMDKHLASMIARDGINISMILMANVILLEKLLKVDKEELVEKLRKEGARYFVNSTKEDK